MSCLSRVEVARSASFRLTIGYATTFVVGLLAFALLAGLAAQLFIDFQGRSRVEAELASLQEAFRQGGLAAVTARTAEMAEAYDDLEIAAMVTLGEKPPGVLSEVSDWRLLTAADVDEDETPIARSTEIGADLWLTVATETESYHDVGELMWASLAWTLAIAFPMALFSGWQLSRSVAKRLQPIEMTTGGVRDGELSRRAPVSAKGDEFDRLASNVNAMLDTIEVLTRNLRNVTAGIAHDLRTPLSRVRNRLLLLGQDDVGGRERRVEDAIRDIDETLATFDALLKIGQIEAKTGRRDFKPVQLSQLVADLAETYAAVAEARGKSLDARIVQNVEVRGDRALLAQLLSNLLENAIEHTPEKTQIVVELSNGPAGRALAVRDNGPGIPAVEREHIFERFYKAGSGDAKAGNGLGLSIVRSICGLHGFDISLSARPHDTCFTITF